MSRMLSCETCGTQFAPVTGIHSARAWCNNCQAMKPTVETCVEKTTRRMITDDPLLPPLPDEFPQFWLCGCASWMHEEDDPECPQVRAELECRARERATVEDRRQKAAEYLHSEMRRKVAEGKLDYVYYQNYCNSCHTLDVEPLTPPGNTRSQNLENFYKRR